MPWPTFKTVIIPISSPSLFSVQKGQKRKVQCISATTIGSVSQSLASKMFFTRPCRGKRYKLWSPLSYLPTLVFPGLRSGPIHSEIKTHFFRGNKTQNKPIPAGLAEVQAPPRVKTPNSRSSLKFSAESETLPFRLSPPLRGKMPKRS